jgi:hypothetical protein
VAWTPYLLKGYWESTAEAGKRGRGRPRITHAEHVLAYTAAQLYFISRGKRERAGAGGGTAGPFVRVLTMLFEIEGTEIRRDGRDIYERFRARARAVGIGNKKQAPPPGPHLLDALVRSPDDTAIATAVSKAFALPHDR